MKKIRIPRKKKKLGYITRMRTYMPYPCFPKLERYLSYFVIDSGIKKYNITSEELYKKFGRYTMDDVVWWNWVRYKHFGIEPQHSGDFKKYWDYFVNQGVIKIK